MSSVADYSLALNEMVARGILIQDVPNIIMDKLSFIIWHERLVQTVKDAEDDDDEMHETLLNTIATYKQISDPKLLLVALKDLLIDFRSDHGHNILSWLVVDYNKDLNEVFQIFLNAFGQEIMKQLLLARIGRRNILHILYKEYEYDGKQKFYLKLFKFILDCIVGTKSDDEKCELQLFVNKKPSRWILSIIELVKDDKDLKELLESY